MNTQRPCLFFYGNPQILSDCCDKENARIFGCQNKQLFVLCDENNFHVSVCASQGWLGANLRKVSLFSLRNILGNQWSTISKKNWKGLLVPFFSWFCIFFCQEKVKYFSAEKRLSVNFLVLLINHTANLWPRNWWTCAFMCLKKSRLCPESLISMYKFVNFLGESATPVCSKVRAIVHICPTVFTHHFPNGHHGIKNQRRHNTNNHNANKKRIQQFRATLEKKRRHPTFLFIVYCNSFETECNRPPRPTNPLPRPDRYFVEKRVSELWALSP